ncbi:hypothetical protein BH18ACT15_BH18ACT15_03830 [soil metagenome]
MTRAIELDTVVKFSAAGYLVANRLPGDKHMYDLANDIPARSYFEAKRECERQDLARRVRSESLWRRATELGIDPYQAFRGQEALKGRRIGFSELFRALDQVLQEGPR